MESAIETESLSFAYTRAEPLIRGVDLRVPLGSAFGVLGPNGAGKSTLIKLLLGLLFPREGRIRLLGEPLAAGRRTLFRRIGTVIEEPHLYPHLSGRENLRVFCDYRQLEYLRAEEVLEQVGLLGAAGRPVRQYSTGMKQRLAIALALLPDPELLILDEPTNGLDPQGIADVRRLIQHLHQKAGKTIVFCSHILSEVEQVCTHVGILHEGSLRFQGAIGELKSYFFRAGRLMLEVDEPAAAERLLAGSFPDVDTEHSSRLSVRIDHRRQIPEIIDLLRNAGIAIYELRLQEDRLEDYFMEVLKEKPNN